jgi:hypothetical protein
MYIPAKLVLKSYMPKQLEEGMLFITKIHQNTLKEHVEIWKLDKVPLESVEEFITKHGAPVETILIDAESEEPIADSLEIGWWDEGEDVNEYRDITPADITYIIDEWDGFVSILVEESEEDYKLVKMENKVILANIGLYLDEEDDWEDEEEEEEGEPDMCSSCNGTGEDVGEYPCSSCKGTGVDNQSEWFKRRYNKNYGREE